MAFGDPDFPVRTDDPYTNYLVDLGVKVDAGEEGVSSADLRMPTYEEVRDVYEREVLHHREQDAG